MKIFKLFMFLIFIYVCIFSKGVFAYNLEGYYYTNSHGVTFSYEEYDFISRFYFEGYQEYMTQDDYLLFVNSNIINGDLHIQELDYIPPKIFTKDLIHETSMKKLRLSISCTTNCFVSTILEWKSLPVVRSYDHIGAYLNGTSLLGSISSKLFFNGNTYNSSYATNTSNGVDAIFKLPTGNTGTMYLVQSFMVSNSGIINVSYQHARNTISLANSKKYTFSNLGFGGVYLFNSGINSYYDGMGGLSYTF